MCSDGKLAEQPFGSWSSLLPDGCSNRKVFLSNVQITCTAVMSRSPLQASTYKVITRESLKTYLWLMTCNKHS